MKCSGTSRPRCSAIHAHSASISASESLCPASGRRIADTCNFVRQEPPSACRSPRPDGRIYPWPENVSAFYDQGRQFVPQTESRVLTQPQGTNDVSKPPTAHPTPNTSSTEPAASATAVISTTGDLDDAAAARLLRWCEARLHLLDIGHAPLNHLLVDVQHAHHATPSRVASDHARVEAARRHVEIHLVGAGQIMISSSLPVRQRLGR